MSLSDECLSLSLPDEGLYLSVPDECLSLILPDEGLFLSLPYESLSLSLPDDGVSTISPRALHWVSAFCLYLHMKYKY